ncbi:EpsG family protein, partial [Vibrio cyclitrophicus]
YLIVLLFLFLFSFIEFFLKNKDKNLLLGGGIVLLLSLFASFRWETGSDFLTYLEIYNYIPSIFSGRDIFDGYNNIEPGFKILVAISKSFNSSAVYFFICCIFSLLPFLLGIKNINKIESIGYAIPLAIYFCLFMIGYNFNAMRQAISMGFFVYSLYYMFNGKTFSVLLLSALAFSFHSTGALIFISYFVYRYFKVDNYNKIIIIFIFSIFLLYFKPLTTILNFLSINTSGWQDKWGGIDYVGILSRIFLFSLIIYIPGLVKKNNFYSFLLTLYSFGFLIYFSLSDVGMMATRFNMYFRVLETIMFSIVLNNVHYRLNKYLIFTLLVLYLLVVFFTTSLSPVNIYNLR